MRLGRVLAAAAVSTIFALLTPFLIPAQSPRAAPIGRTLTGVPRVVDGDTITVEGINIRLNGIDAEETAHWGRPAEPHGDAARATLQEIVGVGAPVRCELNGDRTYDRAVATCYDARGRDIGAELVRRGAALDCAHYSHGRYRSLEPAGARQRLIQKPYC